MTSSLRAKSILAAMLLCAPILTAETAVADGTVPTLLGKNAPDNAIIQPGADPWAGRSHVRVNGFGNGEDELSIAFSENVDIKPFPAERDINDYLTLAGTKANGTVISGLELIQGGNETGAKSDRMPIKRNGQAFSFDAGDVLEVTYTSLAETEQFIVASDDNTPMVSQTVAVIVPPDGPILGTISRVDQDGTTLTVDFDSLVNTDPNNGGKTATPSMFTVKTASNGSSIGSASTVSIDRIDSPTSPSINIGAIDLILSTRIPAGNEVWLSLTAGGLVDKQGDSVGTFTFPPSLYTDKKIINNAVADTTAPAVQSASISSDGLTLSMNFNEALAAISPPSLPSAELFTVVSDGAPVTVQSVGAIASNATTVDLTLAEEIVAGATVTVDYDTSGDTTNKIVIQDGAGNAVNFTGFSVSTNNSEVPATAPTAPPYTGPLIEGVKDNGSSQFSASGTETAVFEGERLGTVTKAFINGIEAEVLSTSNDEFEVSIPEGLEPGTYDLEITSSAGNLTYLDAITIVGTTSVETTSYGEVTAWTSRISDTQVKVYVKFPTVGEKVRISHQTGGSGSYESIYVKTTSSETMEGLRIVEGVGTYIVRTIDLEDINRIRVTVGDEELVQVRYNN